ncbi:HAMP domain-containing sensor histidine kinase [Spirosoma sp. SC4-14]|uniref:sensor histidine kinase n=1 Tax=Spirosoma sp. SC4-14 TaxID=3128900 RepID=UPI0030D62ADB
MKSESLLSTKQPDLATYLFGRREAILNNWRTVCEQDETLQAVSGLSREEFNDMVPTILNVLGHQLNNEQPENDPIQVASEHGLHRWHKGYTLRELLKEIGHLFHVVSEEVDRYQTLYSTANASVFTQAYQKLLHLNQATVEGSAARYDEMERTAASSRADTLQSALNQLSELTRRRNDLLRVSSHDLTSSVGIAQGAAAMLDLENQSPEERTQLMDMLNRNLANLKTMLQSLMDLARLEAGRELPLISRFDVAKLLRELVEDAQPFAAQRQLTLLANGPYELLIESDAEKIRRIVQNLLVNALNYTSAGVVSVSWGEEDDYRFNIAVQDTGPGLSSSIVQSMVGLLKPMPESALVFDSRQLPEPAASLNSVTPKGEGVGLHIVKRLCELLDANLDVETAPDKGTLIRVRFSRVYRKMQ